MCSLQNTWPTLIKVENDKPVSHSYITLIDVQEIN